MSKRAKPATIGGFVAGALVLLITGALVFGGGQFLTASLKYVIFFPGSVKGLQKGAPVKFRGVTIGSVSDIDPILNTQTGDVDIQVEIELPRDDQLLLVGGESRLTQLSDREMMDFFVKQQGMRARLVLQSFLTGLLFVDLDFYPDRPIKLVDIPTRYPQLPAIESGLERLQKTLETLPIEQIVAKGVASLDKLNEALDGVNRVVNSPELMATVKSASEASAAADRLMTALDAEVKPMVAKLETTLEALRRAALQAQKTLALEDGEPAALAASFRRAADNLATAMSSVGETMSALHTATAAESPLRLELREMAAQLTNAARSVRVLADYLERHPEALLRGKQ